MRPKPALVSVDLEGILTPEIWIAVAEKTGIEALRLTTREVPDYDQLMKGRLRILREHQLALPDIQAVIETIDPLPGAVDFVRWVRARTPLIVLTDSFYEFTAPLLAKLEFPTTFCNTLEVDQDQRIVNYHLRQADGKRAAVAAMKGIGFRVIAVGDSYNDTTMLAEAHAGFLFRPPANVAAQFSHYPVLSAYGELQACLAELLTGDR